MAKPLILYTRPGCPFSAKVLIEAAIIGIDLEERNIAIKEIGDELLARGGKIQTPFLFDEENHRSLYESDAILAYLHERFA